MTQYVVAIAVVVFVLLSTSMFAALYHHRKREIVNGRPLLSMEVRKASHEVSNEVQKLTIVTKRISATDDPIATLVASVTNGQNVAR